MILLSPRKAMTPVLMHVKALAKALLSAWAVFRKS